MNYAPSPSTKRVLLVAPSYRDVYAQTQIRAGVPYTPLLSLAALAGELERCGQCVEILDLNFADEPLALVRQRTREFEPDIAGITFTTPLFYQMAGIAATVKDVRPECLTVAGGPHASSYPERTMADAPLDIVAVGEADSVLVEVAEGRELKDIAGICCRPGGDGPLMTEERPRVKDLDSLAFPSWRLYDLSKYHTTELLAWHNPAGYIETSRGCVFGCTYCNKNIFGRTFRVKSPKRVVDEMQHMLDAGFREIHIADDGFTTDMKRAKAICDEILRRDVAIPWATLTGIRVDRVDRELLGKMKAAGCYRVYFGIESGSQRIIDRIQKGITLDQVRQAVTDAKAVGLEVFGFFMMALPGETERDLQMTIDFARELRLDMAKVAITVPLPGTPLYDELEAAGRIKTQDWSRFNLYTPACEVYDHPDLDWDTVENYYKKFYREFYLRPSYVMRRFARGVRTGQLLSDARNFVRTKW